MGCAEIGWWFHPCSTSPRRLRSSEWAVWLERSVRHRRWEARNSPESGDSGEHQEGRYYRAEIRRRAACKRNPDFYTSNINVMHNLWTGSLCDAIADWCHYAGILWQDIFLCAKWLFCAGHFVRIILFNLYTKPLRLVLFPYNSTRDDTETQIIKYNSFPGIRMFNWAVVDLGFRLWSFWFQNPDDQLCTCVLNNWIRNE